MQDLGLGGKGIYKSNITISFNLQTLCFIPRDKINTVFKKIKSKINIG